MSISEKIISWSSMNSDLLFLLGSLSIFILIISVFMMVLIISFLPEDYFKSENRNLISSVQNSRYPLLKLLVLITKNFFGVLLLLSGILMLVLPGQGILTIITGLVFMDYPGKYKFERKLLRQKGVINSINWIRSRLSKPSLKV
ncbi:MAG: PGPGW domain-containing protein [Gammaproteobacteria bacterium]|jgi:hypothetical protein|uniref:Transmembrane protein (PGPGW) n=1 Tax=SAR86 cluster bacterium TaxID=2030880 RepID=A0A368BR99_9GAMM|nr:MAG: hypothetical protein DBW96_04100 [SAR86 cluster bacterium]GIR06521.1 MAG: hypothetical protein CM15mP17_04770 [Gammaproteobacteria bacterium]|tara:strand:- start:528 stop:959 length:432 start_codon:yes stop_codon:yes gene_type:complete